MIDNLLIIYYNSFISFWRCGGMADTPDSKSGIFTDVQVQVLSPLYLKQGKGFCRDAGPFFYLKEFGRRGKGKNIKHSKGL